MTTVPNGVSERFTLLDGPRPDLAISPPHREGYVSDNKQASALDRIRRIRTVSMYAFCVVTLGVVGCAILRDIGRLTPGIYGLVLTLWQLAGIAAVALQCSVWLCRLEIRNTRRAEQFEDNVDRLAEVMTVAEFMTAMDDGRTNGKR